MYPWLFLFMPVLDIGPICLSFSRYIQQKTRKTYQLYTKCLFLVTWLASQIRASLNHIRLVFSVTWRNMYMCPSSYTTNPTNSFQSALWVFAQKVIYNRLKSNTKDYLQNFKVSRDEVITKLLEITFWAFTYKVLWKQLVGLMVYPNPNIFITITITIYHLWRDLFMCKIVHIRNYNVKSHWKVQGCNSTPE